MMHSTLVATFVIAVSVAAALPTTATDKIIREPEALIRNGSGRIVGGSPASKGQFPWQVDIEHDDRLNGGVLIADQWVLVSAHWVYGKLGSFTVLLGTTALYSSDMLEIEAASLYIHPDFNYDTYENSLALLKLASPVVVSTAIKPVRLSSAQLPDGSAITVSGFGVQGDGHDFNADLRYVELTTISNSQCSQIFSTVNEGIVCAVGNGIQGLCNGDMGAAAVNSVNELVAIGLFISSSGCEFGRPSGFTRIAPYVSWINNIINSH